MCTNVCIVSDLLSSHRGISGDIGSVSVNDPAKLRCTLCDLLAIHNTLNELNHAKLPNNMLE